MAVHDSHDLIGGVISDAEYCAVCGRSAAHEVGLRALARPCPKIHYTDSLLPVSLEKADARGEVLDEDTQATLAATPRRAPYARSLDEVARRGRGRRPRGGGRPR